jgi:signal peptidase I
VLGNRRSYAETVQGRRKLARWIGILFLVFVCYEAVSGLFVSAYSMRSASMAPTIIPGERLIASPLPFGPRTPFGKLLGVARPERGDIVVVEPSFARPSGFWAMFADGFVRFVTFQIVSPMRDGPDGILSAPALLRVVGLPGDEIKMDDFIFKVKAAGSDQFLTEFELSSSSYDISHEDAPEAWGLGLPGSGHMDSRVLGKGEYFVAGDERSSASDSRLWGPVRAERFIAKALIRYWPPKSFGAL